MTNAAGSGGGPLIVVAAALVDGRGRILVQRRRPGTAHAGLWEFPGGKVEPGETLVAALVRELGEELGIAVDPAVPVPVAFSTAAAGTGELLLLLYRVDRWRGEPCALDAAALAWTDPEALDALGMPEADRPLIAALRRPS